MGKPHYRAIFISDVHLGTSGCKAKLLCQFLKEHHCDNLYLVGDMLDMWAMNRSVSWTQDHTNVIRRILTKAKRGTKVTYVPGNHDEFLRPYLRTALAMGNITISKHAEHVDARGMRWLVTHGDMFDSITRNWKWVSLCGDRAYALLLKSNNLVHRVRNWFGLGHWSLSKFLKDNTKQAVNFIVSYETHLSEHAKLHGYLGVICGHIHKLEIKKISNVWYLNCGDWVESCTALVENHDGTWNTIEWTGQWHHGSAIRCD